MAGPWYPGRDAAGSRQKITIFPASVLQEIYDRLETKKQDHGDLPEGCNDLFEGGN